MKTESMADPVN